MIMRQYSLCVPVLDRFCLHLAERATDGKPTTFNQKKVKVVGWRIMPDKKAIEFKIEEVNSYV